MRSRPGSATSEDLEVKANTLVPRKHRNSVWGCQRGGGRQWLEAAKAISALRHANQKGHSKELNPTSSEANKKHENAPSKKLTCD